MVDPLDADQARRRVMRALTQQRQGDPQPLIQLLQRHRRLPFSGAEWQELLAPICPMLPAAVLHPSLLPAQLLADPQQWQPASSGIDGVALLAAHPGLPNLEALVASPLFQQILAGEEPLYSDLPPVALAAYGAQLRVEERRRCRQQQLSALSHLASWGWQQFRRGLSPSRVLDRFLLVSFDPPPPPSSPHQQHAWPQLLVVLEADQPTALRQAACGGWSQVLALEPSELTQLAPALAQLPEEALVSFCHATDQLDRQACQRIAAAAVAQPQAALLSSDELIQWAPAGVAAAANRQCRVAPTPLRLLTRGALGGLVSLRAGTLHTLLLPERCSCLHALLFNLALQLAQRSSPFGHCPQALLARNLQANPNIPDVATPRDRLAFRESQHAEIQLIAAQHAGTLLAPGGRLEPHPSLRGCLRLAFTPPPELLISILIPFRDGLELTRVCVASIRRFAGSIPYELVLIDNGSSEPATLAWLEQQAALADVQVLRLPIPFNFSRLNNLARPHCRGSHLLLLNNDVEFAGPNVLARLLDPFAYTNTAAVGARLHYPDGSIQHQGVILAKGEARAVIEPGKGLVDQSVINTLTPLNTQEEFSAASAACLLLKLDDFDAIGGMDEAFAVTLNDINLCLRLRARGKSIVITQEPRLIHHESLSRGKTKALGGEAIARSQREQGLLREKHAMCFAEGDSLISSRLNLLGNDYTERPPEDPKRQPVREGIIYCWQRKQFKPNPLRPILFFAQYGADGDIRADIPPLLKAYSRHADVIFIGATPKLKHNPSSLRSLQRHCQAIVLRNNEGHDFGSWMTGLRLWREEIALKGMEIILANDSFFGPVRTLSTLFEKINKCDADVIGLTHNLMYEPHLQSPFMLYRQRAISSPAFKEFWDTLIVEPSKKELIKKCEVGLPVRLVKAGLSLASLYIKNGHGNDFHFRWKELIENQGFPFIKVSLLRDNHTRQVIDDWPQVVGRHNLSLVRQIQAHLASVQALE